MTPVAPDGRQRYARRLANVMKLTRIAYETSRMELIGALSDQQMRVYDLVFHRESTETAVVIEALGVKPNHASGLLKELTDLGLLERTAITDVAGKRFVYRIK